MNLQIHIKRLAIMNVIKALFYTDESKQKNIAIEWEYNTCLFIVRDLETHESLDVFITSQPITDLKKIFEYIGEKLNSIMNYIYSIENEDKND